MDSNKVSSTTEDSANSTDNSKSGDKGGLLDNKDLSARTKLGHSMAERVAKGASLEQVAFQNNMTADQAGQLISELVVRMSRCSISRD
ncbi:hypothetical protein CLAIMM_07473 [Cladophialophora immunda]|nr:hypothetical protein CLAIMM_07473 [Cladophialophora immunda]